MNITDYNIPLETYREIQKYTDINNLLITCKYYEFHKKELFVHKIILNRKKSIQYCHNKNNFRNEFNKKYKMFILNLDLTNTDIFDKSIDVNIFKNVHTINLLDYDNLDYLYELSLYDNKTLKAILRVDKIIYGNGKKNETVFLSFSYNYSTKKTTYY